MAGPTRAICCALLIVLIVNEYAYPLAPESKAEALGRAARAVGGPLRPLEEFVNQLETHPGRRVLDLGCGTGRKTYDMSKADPGALVAGVDIDKDRLKTAKRSYPREKNPNLYFFKADVQKLPFPDNSFDRITIYYPNLIQPGFSYESNYFYMTFLQEAVRVARPGAVIMVESEDQHTQRVVFQAISSIGECTVNPPFTRKGEYLVRRLEVTVRKQEERRVAPVRIDRGNSAIGTSS